MRYLSSLSLYWPLFFLGVVLYAQHAWVDGFFHDGYLYASLGKNAALLDYWLVPHYTSEVYDRFFHHGPFIFILEGLFFKIFGVSNVSARLFMSLFSIGTLFLSIYWISREKKNNGWSWLTGMVFLLTLPVIKSSRFPNLDIPLMFFFSCSLYFYYRGFLGKFFNFFPCGFFFGLSLLTKGPVGLLIPVIITVHWFLIKGMKRYLAMVGIVLGIGIIVFSFWPLSLYFTDNIDIFQKYLHFTFTHTIKEGRGIEELNPFSYIIFLLKYCSLWFLLAVYSSFKGIKKKDGLFLLYLCSFWIPLLLFSLQKQQYPHYLMPIYPFMSAIASYSFISIAWRIINSLKITVLILSCVLLIFPITTRVHRDWEIHKIISLVRLLENKPNRWGIVDNATPFYNTTGVLAWKESIPVSALKSDEILNWQKQEGWLLFVSKDIWKKWQKDKRIKDNWIIFALFPEKNLVVLLKKNLWNGYLHVQR